MGQREIKDCVRKKWDGKMDGWTEEINRIDGRDGGVQTMDARDGWMD